MIYSIELETKAKKEFFKLTREGQELLAAVIEDLSVEPRPSGSKKLQGVEGYRVRKGKYHILYTINDRLKLIRIRIDSN